MGRSRRDPIRAAAATTMTLHLPMLRQNLRWRPRVPNGAPAVGKRLVTLPEVVACCSAREALFFFSFLSCLSHGRIRTSYFCQTLYGTNGKPGSGVLASSCVAEVSFVGS